MEYSYRCHYGEPKGAKPLRPRPDLEPLYWLMALKEYKDEYGDTVYKVRPNKSFMSYLCISATGLVRPVVLNITGTITQLATYTGFMSRYWP